MTPATGIGRAAVPHAGALQPLRRHPLLFFVLIAYAVSWAYTLPGLQERWGPLAASVVVGLLWAAWHAPQYLRPDWAAINGGFTPWGAGVFVLSLVTFSVIVTWVFNHTGGSVLMAILLHASL